MGTVGLVATVGYHVPGQFPLGGFDPLVGFAGWHVPGQGIGNGRADGAVDIRQRLDHLANDPEYLEQVGTPHQGAGQVVPGIFRGQIEVELVIDQVGIVTAHIERQAAGAQVGTRHAQLQRFLLVEHPYASGTADEHLVAEHQVIVVLQAAFEIIEGAGDPLQPAVGYVPPHAAGDVVDVIDPATAEFLEQVENQIPVRHAPVMRGVHAVGGTQAAEIKEIGCETGHFHLQHAQPLGSRRHFQATQVLYRETVDDFHGYGVGYADTWRDGDILNPQAVFHELLEAPVQVTCIGPALQHGIATDLDPESIVAFDARMVGTEVEFEFVARRLALGFVVLRSHSLFLRLKRCSSGWMAMPPPWVSSSCSQSGW